MKYSYKIAIGLACGALCSFPLNQPCADTVTGEQTGLCAAAGVDYGWVKFNTSKYSSIPSRYANRMIRHEFAHILGLGHDHTCPPISIMKTVSVCEGYNTSNIIYTLQQADIDLIRSWYP
ncbi:hypothetical protein [Endothiovibrio diazotrophicus]